MKVIDPISLSNTLRNKIANIDSLYTFVSFLRFWELSIIPLLQKNRDDPNILSEIDQHVYRDISNATLKCLDQLIDSWSFKKKIDKASHFYNNILKNTKYNSIDKFYNSLEDELSYHQLNRLINCIQSEVFHRILLQSINVNADSLNGLMTCSRLFNNCFDNPQYFYDIKSDFIPIAQKFYTDYETAIYQLYNLDSKSKTNIIPLIYSYAEQHAYVSAGIDFLRYICENNCKKIKDVNNTLSLILKLYQNSEIDYLEPTIKLHENSSILSLLSYIDRNRIIVDKIKLTYRTAYAFNDGINFYFVDLPFRIFSILKNNNLDKQHINQAREMLNTDILMALQLNRDILPNSAHTNRIESYRLFIDKLDSRPSNANVMAIKRNLSINIVKSLMKIITNNISDNDNYRSVISYSDFIICILDCNEKYITQAIKDNMVPWLMKMY